MYRPVAGLTVSLVFCPVDISLESVSAYPEAGAHACRSTLYPGLWTAQAQKMSKPNTGPAAQGGVRLRELPTSATLAGGNCRGHTSFHSLVSVGVVYLLIECMSRYTRSELAPSGRAPSCVRTTVWAGEVTRAYQLSRSIVASLKQQVNPPKVRYVNTKCDNPQSVEQRLRGNPNAPSANLLLKRIVAPEETGVKRM